MKKLLGLIALLPAFYACGSGIEGGSPQPTSSGGEQEPSLRVLELDEAHGKLLADYIGSDGVSVRYDVRLGPPMQTAPSAEELAANPDLPTHETDVRVLDADGNTLYLQMGGDSFIDSSWQMPTLENIDVARRTRELQLVDESRAALRGLPMPESLQPMRNGVLEAARISAVSSSAPAEALPEISAVDHDGALEVAKVTDLSQAQASSQVALPSTVQVGSQHLAARAVQAQATVALWDYVVWKKQVHVINIPVAADHSAVELRGFTNKGVKVFSAVSCNHDTCAAGSGMSKHCTKNAYFRDDGTHSRYFFSDPSTTTGSSQGGCSTPYGWKSESGHHNCNDDSELQLQAISSDSSKSTTGGVCTSSTSHYHAPDCTY